jgi:hypothetical protein
MHPFVQMLSSLFEASAGLSEESLQHMVQALITISGESLQLAYNNREPSLFAIAKLLETGQVGFFFNSPPAGLQQQGAQPLRHRQAP